MDSLSINLHWIGFTREAVKVGGDWVRHDNRHG